LRGRGARIGRRLWRKPEYPLDGSTRNVKLLGNGPDGLPGPIAPRRPGNGSHGQGGERDEPAGWGSVRMGEGRTSQGLSRPLRQQALDRQAELPAADGLQCIGSLRKFPGAVKTAVSRRLECYRGVYRRAI
jgi:hypothetical protein